jgi:hypothetical protein
VTASTLTRALRISAATAIAATIAMFGAAYLLLGPPAQLLQDLRMQAGGGFLEAQFRPFLLRSDFTVRLWDHNECLILYMLVAPGYGSPWKEALSPLRPLGKPGENACDVMRDELSGQPVEGQSYHQYLHGYRLPTALLLKVMPAGAVPWVVDIAIHALVLALLAGAIMRALGTSRRAEGIGYAVVGGCLLLFWGLQRSGASISFVFGDATVVLLVCWFFLFNPLRSSERAFLLACSIAGAMVAHFEFLTGQIPLATPIIPLCLVIASLCEPNSSLLVRRAIAGPCVFLLTGGFCFAIKYAALAAVFGPGVLVDIMNEGALVTVGHWDFEVAPGAAAFLRSLGLPTSYTGGLFNSTFWLFASLALATPAIGLGSFFLGAAVLILSSALIVSGWVHASKRSRAPIDRTRLIALAGSLALLAGWYLLFRMHTIRHAGFMIRPLVLLPIIAGIVWLCARQSGRMGPSQSDGRVHIPK